MRRWSGASYGRSVSPLHLVVGKAEPDPESDFNADQYHGVASPQLCESQQNELHNHDDAKEEQEGPDSRIRYLVRKSALGYWKKMGRYRQDFAGIPRYQEFSNRNGRRQSREDQGRPLECQETPPDSSSLRHSKTVSHNPE